MSLSFFALQSHTHNTNTTTIDLGRSDSEEGLFIKVFPLLPDEPCPGKHLHEESTFHQQVH